MADKRDVEVLWDFEACKIPIDDKIPHNEFRGFDVARKIKATLYKTGYSGNVTITGYGDLSNTCGYRFCDGGIGTKHTNEEEKEERLSMILADLLCRAVGRANRVNFVLIIADISRHVGFLRALRYLKSKKCYDVVLVHPDVVSKKLHLTVRYAWVWSSFLDGENPKKKPRKRKGKGYELSDVVPYIRANTAVFWDMDDCPIPDGLNACEVLSNIRLALAKEGYVDGNVSFYAYGETNLIEDLESSGVVYLPTSGVKAADHEKMFLDFAFCLVDNPDTRNLVVIVGEVKGEAFEEFYVALRILRNKGYRKRLLSHPKNVRGQFSSDSSLVRPPWEWLSTGSGTINP